MLETKERKYKREIAELQKENAKLYINIAELKKDGQVKAQKEYTMKVIKENEELKTGASQLQDAMDAIMNEIIDKYGKDNSININLPKIKIDPHYKIMVEKIGEKMFIRKEFIPEIKS